MKRTTKLIGFIFVTAEAVTAGYMKAIYDGGGGKELALTKQAVAAETKSSASPIKAWANGLSTRFAGPVNQIRFTY